MGGVERVTERPSPSIIQRARYRAWQFWQTLVPRPLPATAWYEIRSILDSREQNLFSRQSPGGQQHGYRVMRTLKVAGHEKQELLAAALLHDVGKTDNEPGRWAKSMVVLAQALLPKKAEVWASGEARGWKRPFVVKARHAEWGASSAEEAGSSPLTISLIRRHQDPRLPVLENDEDQFLELLQRADDLN